MVQRKTFFDKVVQKVRRDAGAAWTGANLDDMRSISSLVEGRLGSAGERLAEAGFMPALQQEALIRALDERRRAELGCKADDPPVFPGLMAAWDSRPATLSFDGALLDRARKSGIETLTAKLDSVRELLPLCLLADIRPWGADLYGNPVDALFMYPSHDLDRGYDVFLLVAVGLKTGLRMPAESRLVLSGDTLADAVDLSVAERELLRGRCLAGIDNGLHDEIFSPFEDEEAVMLLAADALGLLFHGISEMDAAEGPRGLRITARLAEEPASSAAVDAEGAAPPEEPDVESRDEGGAEQVAHILAGDEGDASEASAGSGEGAGESQGGDSGPSTAPGASVSCIGESHDAAELTAQIESLRSQLEAAESKASTLEYHLRQANSMAAEAQREAQGALARASVLETLDLPATAAEALALAERAFPDRLAVMPDARKSADDFKKGDAAEVWAVLRSVAVILHPLVFGRGGGNMIHAFEAQSGFEITLREMKMIKQAGQYAHLRTVRYKGEDRDASAHVKGRGRKRGDSLRVHFFADYDEKKLVIAHCGEHLATYDTASL